MEQLSDLYDKIKSDVAFRKEMAEKAGLGFELPSKICVIGRNGRKIESEPVLELAARDKWSGRKDLNLRPPGPEPSL